MPTTERYDNEMRRRLRRERIIAWFRHGVEPLLVLALHAAVLWLIYLGAEISSREPESQTIEVTVVDPNALELDLTDLELTPDEMTEPDEAFDFAIPSPEMFATESLPEVQDFSAIAPIDSPVILSGFTLMDTGLSEVQLSRGAGSHFGFDEYARGDLTGTLYDLKRNGVGQARAMDFTRDLHGLVEARFSNKALKQFYRVPKPLYLSHLLQPYIPAEQGPEAFGVGKLMEPRQWIVHYTGQFQCLLSGRYRFVGDFDDILLVFVNGSLVLEAGWGDPVTDWRPQENVGTDLCYTTHPLVYGDWVELPPLKPMRIDIVIGENPGGWMGGLLLVEQEGRTYQRDAAGRAILPLFALQPLTETEQASLRQFPGFAIEEQTPIMGIRSDMAFLEKNKTANNDEVKVTVE